MDVSLLATKLHFPLVRHSFVPRPRLVEHLNQGLRSALTLISGSAGSGKTTLLSEWHAQVGGDIPAAWLSLDDRDNDLQLFLAYLAASLDRIQPGLKNNIYTILETPQAPDAEMILTALINALSVVDTDFVLVLDDYHAITTPEIHAAVSFLVENLPYQMHLVILTRVDPPLPLARLRSRGQLTELRNKDLRFTLDEAAEFLRQVMQLSITDAHVAALESRTEGWAAGLQMAALSMAHQPDLDAFVESFTGSHRYLMDYLIEEVIQQQPGQVQAFLERTSILDRFTAALCIAVTGDENSPGILENLDRSNLFLVPLDEHREWYRYHHLFAELLRHRLQLSSQQDTAELYQRASDWCAQNKWTDEAIDYALLAKNMPYAAQLIQSAILLTLVVPTRWLVAIPDKILNRYPAILTAQSSNALLSHLRDTELMKPPLERAQDAIHNLPPDAPQRNLVEAHWLITRALAAVEQNELTAAMDWVIQAQGLLPADGLALNYYANIVLSQAARNLGDNEQALQAAIAAECFARQVGLLARAYIAVTLQLSIYIQQGKLQSVIDQGQQTLAEYPTEALLGTIPPSLGGIYIYLARVYYEQNKLEQALQYLQKGLQLLRLTQQSSLETHGYILAADIHAAQGDWEQAFQAIDQAKQSRPIWVRTIGTAYITLLLRRDDLTVYEAELAHWYEQERSLLGSISPAELSHAVQNTVVFQTLVRVLLTLRRLGHKADLLPDMLQIEQTLEQHQTKIKSQADTQNLLDGYITLALLKDGLNKPDEAEEAIKQALSLGAQHGYLRTFLDETRPLEDLIRRVIRHGEASQYAKQLLDAFQPHFAPKPVAPRAQGLIEPLTEREQDVLRLLAAGLSNPEIARELYLGLNTIKTHTRGIYGKLGVSNRTQATVRAHELGLV